MGGRRRRRAERTLPPQLPPPAAIAQPPPSLSIPDHRPRGGRTAPAPPRLAPAVTFVPCSSCSPLLPPPRPGSGGDSPLATEPSVSGRAALRPLPALSPPPARLRARRRVCSGRRSGGSPAVPPGAAARGRTLSRRRRRRTAAQPRTARVPRTNAAAAAGEPAHPAGRLRGRQPRWQAGGDGGCYGSGSAPCAARMEQPPRPRTGAR